MRTYILLMWFCEYLLRRIHALEYTSSMFTRAGGAEKARFCSRWRARLSDKT